MDIRTATPSDYALIRGLAHRIWPTAYGNILSDAQISYMLELFYSDTGLDHVAKSGQQFLILTDGEPLGFAGYELHTTGETTKLHKLYVLPDSQGNGYGTVLLDAVVQRSISGGDTKIKLNVNRFNRARLFYERLGFAVIAEENIDIGNGFWMEDFIMERELQP